MTKRNPKGASALLDIKRREKAVKVHFYLAETDADAIIALARKYNCSQSEFIRSLVRSHARDMGVIK
jgi:hypothetical protein